MPHIITPGRLDMAVLRRAALDTPPDGHKTVERFVIDDAARAGIDASVRAVRELVSRHDAVYGINTGFGKLAQTRIAHELLAQLQ